MSCKCFVNIPKFRQGASFAERLDTSKCTCNARFVVSENKSRFQLLSCTLDEVDKYKIDNYFNQSMIQKKCDYYFKYHPSDKPNVCIFVELKGIDIETAVQQLEATLADFEKNSYFGDIKNTKVFCAIVSTGSPSNDSTYRSLIKNLKSNHKRLNPIVERKKYEMKYNPKTGECFGIGEK
jgi:hypothetical protein